MFTGGIGCKETSRWNIQIRFCVDLKKVNSVTAKDSYSLPRISETVDALSGAKYFTTMDVDRAFWHVGLAKEDKKKQHLQFEESYMSVMSCHMDH